MSAAQFVQDLAAITAAKIHLRINSPGGDVFEGRAIATAIREHPAEVLAHVDGLAASAASYVALAADRVQISRGAMFMIHNAWVFALGNRDDLRKMADLLEKIDGDLVADYVRETGAAQDQVEAWMAAETWFTAEEALEAGFADAIAGDEEDDEEDEDEAMAAARATAWDLAAYDNAPGRAARIEQFKAEADRLGLVTVPKVELEQAARVAHDERRRRFELTDRLTG